VKIDFYNIKVPIYQTVLDIDIDYKNKLLEAIPKIEDDFNYTSNVKAKMSNSRLWEINPLFTKILIQLGEEIEKFDISKYITAYKREIYPKITNLWSIIYKKGDYAIPHIHGNELAFSLYLNNDEECPLYFDDLDLKIYPQENKLVLFPAFLTHSVPKKKTNNPRIVLAGNVKYELK
jgi:hypothetical protein